MELNLLGPLEVIVDDRAVPLGGINQRAVLGALLLQANSVVATSRLLKALWNNDPPPTGRKMLQNAVAGLRGILASHGVEARLLTHAPGYLLRVEPEAVDVLRFQRLVERGRTAAAAGALEAASADLGQALGLWRGPALADLVESGIDWPELGVLHNARLAALEDHVEVQLALGRHHAVISELERVVAETEPPRERLCRQLMLALYRAGRQADALGVYRRTRAVLVEKLGLDPSRELRDLERAILSHDPGLAAPPFAHRVVTGRAANPYEVGTPAGETDRDVPPAGSGDPPADATGERPAHPGAAGRGGEPPAAPAVPRTERKRVSVLEMTVPMAPLPTDQDPEDLEQWLIPLTALFRQEVERFGGMIQESTGLGPRWIALFGVPHTREDDVERAVRAALAVRDRLRSAERPSPNGAPPELPRLAVATAETLVTVRHDDGGPAVTEVTGAALDTRLRLLQVAAPGAVQVCDTTLQATSGIFVYEPVAGPPLGWELVSLRSEPAVTEYRIPLLERDRELDMLRGLYEKVRFRRRPHLLTVLGEAGVGKSRLVEEFGRELACSGDPVRWCVGRVPPLGEDATSVALTGDAGPAVGDGAAGGGANPLVSWRSLLEETTREPLVVVLEDLHRADDFLLDSVEEFVEHVARTPLLLITTARTELLSRRPSWSGGKRNATMLTLEPLSDGATRQLLANLALRYGMCGHPPESDIWRAASEQESRYDAYEALVRRTGGIPGFVVEYVEMCRQRTAGEVGDCAVDDAVAREPDPPFALPQSVRSIIAARIDALPTTEKAVLQDAAVFGESFCPEAVAALGDGDVITVEGCLDALERRDLLRRLRGAPRNGRPWYAFQHLLVRDVAYAQLPRAARAEKHRRAARWLSGLTGSDQAQLLAYHRENATALAAAASPTLDELTGQAGWALRPAGRAVSRPPAKRR